MMRQFWCGSSVKMLFTKFILSKHRCDAYFYAKLLAKGVGIVQALWFFSHLKTNMMHSPVSGEKNTAME